MRLGNSVLSMAVVAGVLIQPFEAAERVVLHCSPKVVSGRDTIELRFSGRRGRELGVRTPDGRFLFLAFTQETPLVVPPIAPSRLKLAAAVSFKVSDAAGAVSTDRGPVERVFTVPGRYLFVASDNLETEDDQGVNGTCDVTLKP